MTLSRAQGRFRDSVQELVDSLKPLDADGLAIARFREFPLSMKYTVFDGNAVEAANSALSMTLRYPSKWERVRRAGEPFELPPHMRQWQDDGTLFLSHVDGSVTMVISDDKRVLTSGDVVMLLNHLCDELAARGAVFRGDLCFACKRQAGAQLVVRAEGFSQLCAMCMEASSGDGESSERLSARRAPALAGAMFVASTAGAIIWAGVWIGVSVFLEAMFKNRTRIMVPDWIVGGFVIISGGLMAFVIGRLLRRLSLVRGAAAKLAAVVCVLLAATAGELVYHGQRFKIPVNAESVLDLLATLPELWSLEGNMPAFRIMTLVFAIIVASLMLGRKTTALP